MTLYSVLYDNAGIIAGSYEEYDQWRRRGLDWQRNTFYILDETSLRGRNPSLVLVIGRGLLKGNLIDIAKRLGFDVRMG